MQQTTKLNLKKPELSDNVNVDDFNYNADIIDSEITAIKEKNTNQDGSITNLKKDVTTLNDNKINKPSAATTGNVAKFNSNKEIVDSGFTIGKSVPSNAEFTDTTYIHPSTHPAHMINISDTGNKYTSTDVEGALQEVATKVDSQKDDIVLDSQTQTGEYTMLEDKAIIVKLDFLPTNITVVNGSNTINYDAITGDRYTINGVTKYFSSEGGYVNSTGFKFWTNWNVGAIAIWTAINTTPRKIKEVLIEHMELTSAQWKILNDSISNIKSKRTCRFVIGTSTAGWTSSDCDYLCDGSNDHIKFNEAIANLHSAGGEIVVLDGTYNITAEIVLNKNNITLTGNGNSTILKRMFNGASDNGVIMIRANTCSINNISIDGNKGVYNNSKNNGIFCTGHSNIITNIICNNNSSSSIYIYGFDNENDVYNNIIENNICNNNNYSGMSIEYSDNTITSNNVCNNNNNAGIRYFYASNGSITSNVCTNNFVGINLNYKNYKNTVVSNACGDNEWGLCISVSNYNTIVGNNCVRGTGLTTDYTSKNETITVSGDKNLIADNNILGKNYTDKGTGNTFVNNKYS